MSVRRDVLLAVADQIPVATGADCVLVGVDGIDATGKTTFADELARLLRERRRPVLRIGADDFLNPRSVRHRRGRNSPDGFYLDSYDYAALHRDVLTPLGRDGERRYRRATYDLRTDRPYSPDPDVAAPGSVVILDGLFLHRPELAGVWDFSVFLRIPFAESVRRMSRRDGLDPLAAGRYVEGERLYLTRCDPAVRATVAIDNTDPQCPVLIPNDRLMPPR